ncbi:MAG: tetratricopeptide repeat protein, partial [Richelia sp. SM2_1_7]|nr:tetratricopeptide repeat protein [Richelia sp. SM2_1_7]
MKGLKTISAIALLGFMLISQKASAQTLPGIDIKPEIKPQIQRLQIESSPNPNSRQDDEKAQAYLDKGIKLFEAEKWSEAIQAFSEAIKIQPNNQYAYFFRGYSYFQLEKYQQAKADLDKTIELDDSISYAYY